MNKRVVVALGGNAILQPNQEATFENQKQNVEISSYHLAEIALAGHQLIITHGNGPQVGNILRQNEIGKEEVPPLPLAACSAKSQGFIGYMMQQSLKNIFSQKKSAVQVACLLTETEVDSHDPAFQNPTKPIGTFYSKEEADKLSKERGWTMGEDAGRGYRRLVPSPKPKKIHGIDTITQLSEQGAVVISTGGGGIPVMKSKKGNLLGIDAVIDKDRSAVLLAKEADADTLMILTDVSNVCLYYGTPKQKKLETVSVYEAEKYHREGHFSDGSMGPKMEAAITFAKLGKEAIICSLHDAVLALEGKAGTRIVKEV